MVQFVVVDRIVCLWGFGSFLKIISPESLLSIENSQITFLSRFQQQYEKEKPSVTQEEIKCKKKKMLLKLSQISTAVSMAVKNVPYTYANKRICYFPYKY